MTRLLFLLLGLAALGGLWLLDSPPRRPVARIGRDLARPVVLPALWRSLDDARRAGTVEEYVTKGRVLMRLVPEWTQGHIHLAGRLAFDASLHQRDPEQALDRLLAAVRLLEAAYAGNPARPEALLTTMAQFVAIRCGQDPALAAAFRRRLDQNPAGFAEACLRRVERFEHSPYLQEELCFLIIGGLAHDIAQEAPDWRRRVRQRLHTAVASLGTVRDPVLRAAWSRSLANLDRYLRGIDDISLRDLENDPRLRKICRALRARPRPETRSKVPR